MPISEQVHTWNEKQFRSSHELKEDSVGPMQWFLPYRKVCFSVCSSYGFVFLNFSLDSVHVIDGCFSSGPGFTGVVPLSQFLPQLRDPFASLSQQSFLQQAATANVLVFQPGSWSGAVLSTWEKTIAIWVLRPLNLSLDSWIPGPSFPRPPGFFSPLHIIKPQGDLIIAPLTLYSLHLILNFAIHPVSKMNLFSLLFESW